MNASWAGWLVFIEQVLIFGTYVAFFLIVALRTRNNNFLFFGWLSVLVVFFLMYATSLVVTLITAR